MVISDERCVLTLDMIQSFSACSWMADEAFQDAIGDAVDAFLEEAPEADIF